MSRNKGKGTVHVGEQRQGNRACWGTNERELCTPQGSLAQSAFLNPQRCTFRFCSTSRLERRLASTFFFLFLSFSEGHRSVSGEGVEQHPLSTGTPWIPERYYRLPLHWIFLSRIRRPHRQVSAPCEFPFTFPFQLASQNRGAYSPRSTRTCNRCPMSDTVPRRLLEALLSKA